MKLRKVLFISAAIAASTFFSCTTLQQDIVISTIPDKDNEEILNLEYRLAYLDSAYSFSENKILSTQELADRNKACDDLIRDINKTFSKGTFVNATLARLKALEGRVYLIQGKTSKAKDASSASTELYRDDIQNIILTHRLGSLQELSTANYQNADKPLILLEQALDFYTSKEYTSAVAKFDEAFISAEAFYFDAYKELRDNAWKFRSIVDDSTLSSYLKISSISIGQMMLITQEYPVIISPYTNGTTYAEAALFKRLSQNGLITPATKSAVPAKTYSYTKVTRAIQARFLWNIYCDIKNKPSLKTRYSTVYSKSTSKSPVKDVALDNEDFDAILGCIEFNLMSLTDGINFNPDATVSGIEFNDAIKKLNK